MSRKFTLICLLALSFFSTTKAKELKPIDAFIERIKSTNKFVPVNDIWQADNLFDQRELLKNVERAQPMTIDYSRVAALLEKKSMAISLTFPGINGGSHTLDLARYDYFSNDFEIHAKGANNSDELVSYTPGLYYSGVVSGIEGSIAVFSFFKNEVYGVFSIPGEGNYVLVPNTMVGKDYDYNSNYILYREDDLKIKDRAPKCGTDDLPEVKGMNFAQKTTTTPNNNVYNSCTYVRCYEVGDWAMYQKKGSSTTNVTNYLTALFNAKATLYRNEGIPIVMKYLEIHTASDPYVSLPTNNSARWLTKFGWVTQNTMHGCDVATLYTTAGGSMGGIAWVKNTCSSYWAPDSAGPYCFCNVNNTASTSVSPFPTYSWDVEVCTHEMGHSVGSPHTHRCCWNPPARNTAIDGCYTIEGSCPNPGVPTPAVKGTIMSYCHLTSSGISFTNGFGTQPGDTIRYYLRTNFSSTCGAVYIPSVTTTKANRTITANRQCTNISGGDTTTYYWFDNNTASVDDDTLVMAARLHGNSFGTLNTSGLTMKMSTLAAYGTGVAQTTTFPASMPGGLRPNKKAFNRYWNITGATAAANTVELMYPFATTDTNDVNKSIPGYTNIKDFRMYKVATTVDPNPATGFASVAVSNITILNYAALPITTAQWGISSSGSILFGHMKLKDVNGGGTGFYDYTYAAVDVNDMNGNTAMTIYPNPTDNEWQVAVNGNANGLTFRLYAADGRLVITQSLTTGVNTVSAAGLATGVYFYRIVGDDNAFTGSLMKN